MTVTENSTIHTGNGQRSTTKARLVVVGNGMAGARAVEEILARNGADLFDITVFGAEPYGNYNRILLSNVLAGSDTADEIYLNPVGWYADNGLDLRAGVRVVRIDAYAHLIWADDGTRMRYDKLILATGSRSFFPPAPSRRRTAQTRSPADRRAVAWWAGESGCRAGAADGA